MASGLTLKEPGRELRKGSADTRGQPHPMIPGIALLGLISGQFPIWVSGLGNRGRCTAWLYQLGKYNGGHLSDKTQVGGDVGA